uniref:Uncharacterized protein n=1 Tax=Anopheles atroparvus TaxID=41427 RepID=A0AAG5DS71_ANOAO
MVMAGMYNQAADAFRREIGLHQQVGSQGAIGCPSLAKKAFKEWGNCCEVAEVQTLESLTQAYDDEDPKLVQMALSPPFIQHIDIEYARLAHNLPLPIGSAIAPKANVIKKCSCIIHVPEQWYSKRCPQAAGRTRW